MRRKLTVKAYCTKQAYSLKLFTRRPFHLFSKREIVSRRPLSRINKWINPLAKRPPTLSPISPLQISPGNKTTVIDNQRMKTTVMDKDDQGRTPQLLQTALFKKWFKKEKITILFFQLFPSIKKERRKIGTSELRNAGCTP